MGTTEAGIIFKNDNNLEIKKTISEIAQVDQSEVEKVDKSNLYEVGFDIRKKSDFMVKKINNLYIIMNGEIADECIEGDKYTENTHKIIGSPNLSMSYFIYDSGGSYAYTIFKNGIKTSGIIQIFDEPIKYFGEMNEIEQKWINSDSYIEKDIDYPDDEGCKIRFLGDKEIEVPETELACQVLYELLIHYFNYDYLDINKEEETYFYTITKFQEPKIVDKKSFFEKIVDFFTK